MAIQVPTTEFKYNGKIFQLLVVVTTAPDNTLPVIDAEDKDNIKAQQFVYQLVNQNIEMLEFVNKFNQLCMSGSIVYNDTEGALARFQYMTNVEVLVDLREILTSADGDISLKNTDENNKYFHTFLVDKMQILGRDGQTIKYRLSLISQNYKAMIRTLHYSNYGADAEKITEILKKLLHSAADNIGLDGNNPNLFVVGENLDQDKVQSDTRIHYTTNGNDNMFNIAKYLLSRTFYYQKNSIQSRDTSIKMLYYDLFDNKYDLFDLGKADLSKSSADIVVLSMLKTSEEDLMYEQPNQLATVVKFPHSKYKKLVFGTHTYDYDLLHNSVIQEYISQKTLTDFHDNFDARDSIMAQQQTTPAEDYNDPDYINQHPYWNNSFTVYDQMVKYLMESNALIVETSPNVRRIPSDIVYIGIPPDTKNITTDSSSEYQNITGRYTQLHGNWIVGSVRNVIYPARQVYKQNLVLFKNYFDKE